MLTLTEKIVFLIFFVNILLFSGTFSFKGAVSSYSDECSSSFKTAPVGNKLLVCKFCMKTFERRGHLLDHMNSHTGERPYVCAFCSKGFTQKTNCKRHIITCPFRVGAPNISKN